MVISSCEDSFLACVIAREASAWDEMGMIATLVTA